MHVGLFGEGGEEAGCARHLQELRGIGRKRGGANGIGAASGCALSQVMTSMVVT